jgi:H+-translocating diphosphatase
MAAPLPVLVPNVLIPLSAVVGIIFALWLWKRVSAIQLTGGQSVFRSQNGREYLLEEEQRGDDEVRRRTSVISGS